MTRPSEARVGKGGVRLTIARVAGPMVVAYSDTEIEQPCSLLMSWYFLAHEV